MKNLFCKTNKYKKSLLINDNNASDLTNDLNIEDLNIDNLTIEDLNISDSNISESNISDSNISELNINCLLYTSPSPRDRQKSRMPSSA